MLKQQIKSHPRRKFNDSKKFYESLAASLRFREPSKQGTGYNNFSQSIEFVKVSSIS